MLKLSKHIEFVKKISYFKSSHKLFYQGKG